MGYTTDFSREFTLNRLLKPEHKAYLQRFAGIRHLPLDEEKLAVYPDPLREAVGLPIGKYGMYFTGLIDPDSVGDDLLLGYSFGSDDRNTISKLEVKHDDAFWMPSTFCQWTPTDEGRGIEASGDKFYGYVKWLRFLLDHFLLPWGYELSGTVSYQGEQGEHGRIIVENHQVRTVVDGDSLLPRSYESAGIGEVMKILWLTIGSISDVARQAILDVGGVVKHLHDEPPVVLVGIPYDCNYYRRFGHDDLAIWTMEGIALYSKDLRLEWSNNNFPGKRWGGFPEKRLILPDEPYEGLLLDED